MEVVVESEGPGKALLDANGDTYHHHTCLVQRRTWYSRYGLYAKYHNYTFSSSYGYMQQTPALPFLWTSTNKDAASLQCLAVVGLHAFSAYRSALVMSLALLARFPVAFSQHARAAFYISKSILERHSRASSVGQCFDEGATLLTFLG